ncbi:Receptor L-domain [Trinorchestia longiramus]|nr:Receptor L-domain [Trinorchestia longiramus]
MLRLLLGLLVVVCSDADVRITRHVIRNGTVVCSSITLTEHVPEDVLHVIRDCTHVDGHVKLLVMHVQPRHVPLMPRLVEVKDSVALFHVSGVEKVGDLFPKLRVVRGSKGKVGFFLEGNEDLVEIGLPGLTMGSSEAGLEILQNWQLCVPAVPPYTVAPASIKDNGVYCEYGLDGCHYDDQSCRQFVATKCSCSNGCASSGIPRPIEESTPRMRTLKSECCHSECLGGCSIGGNAGACTACKHFAQEGYCVQKCSKNYMQYLDYRCVTELQCRALGGKRLTDAQTELCVLQCPLGSVAEEGTTEDHLPHCTRTGNGVCGSIAVGGGVEEGVAPHFTPPVNCTRVVGSVTLKGAFNASQLESLATLFAEGVEVTEYVLVTETSLMSLDFLFNKLSLVRGNNLVGDVYSIYISDNVKLQELRRPRFSPPGHPFPQNTRVVERGEVMVRGNSKLCPSEVVNLLGTHVTSVTRRLADGSTTTHECYEDFSQEHNKLNDVNVPCKLSWIDIRSLRGTTSSMTVAWDPHSYMGPNKYYLHGYFVYYRAVGPGLTVRMFEGRDACNDRRLWQQVQTSDTKAVAGKNSELTLRGLQPGTRYALYVETDVFPTFVENSYHSMPGSRSDIVYCSTLALAPSEPRHLAVRQFTSGSASGTRKLNSVSVSWSPPNKPGGQLQGYQVKLCKVPRPVIVPPAVLATAGSCLNVPRPLTSSALFVPNTAPGVASLSKAPTTGSSSSSAEVDYLDGEGGHFEDQFCNSHQCHRSEEEWLQSKRLQERIYFFDKINSDIFERAQKVPPLRKAPRRSEAYGGDTNEEVHMTPMPFTSGCRPYLPLNNSHQEDVCETFHSPVNWTLYSNVAIDDDECEVRFVLHTRRPTTYSTTFHGLEAFQDFQVSVRACHANTTAPPLTPGGKSSTVALCSSWVNYTNTTASQRSLDAVTNLQMKELHGNPPAGNVLVINAEESGPTDDEDRQRSSESKYAAKEDTKNNLKKVKSSSVMGKKHSSDKLSLKHSDGSLMKEKVPAPAASKVSMRAISHVLANHSWLDVDSGLHGPFSNRVDSTPHKAQVLVADLPEARTASDEPVHGSSSAELLHYQDSHDDSYGTHIASKKLADPELVFEEPSEAYSLSSLVDEPLLSEGARAVSKQVPKTTIASKSVEEEPKGTYLVLWTPPSTPNGGVVLNYTLDIPGYLTRCLAGTVNEVLLTSVPKSRAPFLTLTAHTMAGGGPKVGLGPEFSEVSSLLPTFVVLCCVGVVIIIVVLGAVLRRWFHHQQYLLALDNMCELHNPSYAPFEINDFIIPADHLLIIPPEKEGVLGSGLFGTVSLGYVLRQIDDEEDDIPGDAQQKCISSFSKQSCVRPRFKKAMKAPKSGVEVDVGETQAEEDELDHRSSVCDLSRCPCKEAFRRDRVSFDCPSGSCDHMNDSGESSTRDEDLEEGEEYHGFCERMNLARCLDRGTFGNVISSLGLTETVSRGRRVGQPHCVSDPEAKIQSNFQEGEHASSATGVCQNEGADAKLERELKFAVEELKSQKGQDWKRWKLHKRVAVKQLICKISDQTFEEQELRKKKFNSEASIMQCVMKCPFVVRFEGAVMRDRQMCILMEVLEEGTLLDYITKHPVSEQDVYNFAIQVADGMAYIASKRIIHLDLATRNCLIYQGHIVKIADFGLSKKLNTERCYYHYQLGNEPSLPSFVTDDTHRQRLRIFLPKLMAPEAKKPHILFYFKSDVWAFGVLLWDLLTRASQPLINEEPPSDEAIWRACRTMCGDGLHAPGSTFMKSLLGLCWQTQQHLRPSFEEIVGMLLPRIGPSFVREFRSLSFCLSHKARESESTEDEGVGSMPGSSRDEVDSCQDFPEHIEQSRGQCCLRLLNIGARQRDRGDATNESFDSRRQQLDNFDDNEKLSNVAEVVIPRNMNADEEENIGISSRRVTNRRRFSSTGEAPLHQDGESEQFLSHDQNAPKETQRKGFKRHILSALKHSAVPKSTGSKFDRSDAAEVVNAEQKPLIHVPSADDFQLSSKSKLHLPLKKSKLSTSQRIDSSLKIRNQNAATEQCLTTPLILPSLQRPVHQIEHQSRCSFHASAEKYLDMSPKNPVNDFMKDSGGDTGKDKDFVGLLNDKALEETSLEDNMLWYTEMSYRVSPVDLNLEPESEITHNKSDEKASEISASDDVKLSTMKRAASSNVLTNHETKTVVHFSCVSGGHPEPPRKSESGVSRFFCKGLKDGKSFQLLESCHHDSSTADTQSYGGGSCEDFSLVTCPSFDTLYPSASTCTSAVTSPCEEFCDGNTRVNWIPTLKDAEVSKMTFSDLDVSDPDADINRLGKHSKVSAGNLNSSNEKEHPLNEKNGLFSEHSPGSGIVKLNRSKVNVDSKYDSFYRSRKNQDTIPSIPLATSHLTETKS